MKRSIIEIADQKTTLDIPEDKIKEIKSEINRGSLAHLSSEREAIPFMMFAQGYSFEKISDYCSLPINFIYATALFYEWDKKLNKLRDSSSEFTSEALLGEIYSMTLIVAKMGLQEYAKDVMVGKNSAKNFPLFPQNLHGFEKLITVLEKLKNLENGGSTGSTSSGGTTINANNVQINNGPNEEDSTNSTISYEERTSAEERAEKWKLISGGKI